MAIMPSAPLVVVWESAPTRMPPGSREALDVHVVADAVAGTRVVDPVLARKRLQHPVVVGVLEVELDDVVVDVLHRALDLHPRHVELLELHAAPSSRWRPGGASGRPSARSARRASGRRRRGGRGGSGESGSRALRPIFPPNAGRMRRGSRPLSRKRFRRPLTRQRNPRGTTGPTPPRPPSPARRCSPAPQRPRRRPARRPRAPSRAPAAPRARPRPAPPPRPTRPAPVRPHRPAAS